MTDSELLDKLLEGGCCVGTDGGGTRTVAYARLDQGRCCWVEMFPHDQHHAHGTPYKTTRQFHDRDLALYDESSATVLYFAPYEEWPEIDSCQYLETRRRWLNELKSPENCRRLEAFVCQEFGPPVEL